MSSQQKQSVSQKQAKSFGPTVGKMKDKAVFSITIEKQPEEVFRFWRDFSNLAKFMKDIAEIQILSSTKSHWVVQLKSGPAKGMKAHWDAEIVEEQPGRLISWKSVEGSEVETAGSVRFEPAPGDQGTVVQLSLSYKIPGGKLAEFVTLLSGEDPYHLTQTNLKRLKAYLECGEIPTVEGQSSGRDEDLLPASSLH